MIIGIPKETLSGECRVGITTNTIKELIKHNFEVFIESGSGEGSFISNKDYETVDFIQKSIIEYSCANH